MVSQHHLLQRLLFPHWTVMALFSKIHWPKIKGFNSRLSIVSHWYVCPSSHHNTFLIYVAYSRFWSWEMWVLQLCSSSSFFLFLFFKIVFAHLGPKNFHLNFRIRLLISAKKSAVSLTRLHWTYRSSWRVLSS